MMTVLIIRHYINIPRLQANLVSNFLFLSDMLCFSSYYPMSRRMCNMWCDWLDSLLIATPSNHITRTTAIDVKVYLHIENTQNTCSDHGFGAGDFLLFQFYNRHLIMRVTILSNLTLIYLDSWKCKVTVSW